jgi:hypothetical protein
LDFALLKDTAVPKVSEQFKVEFRAEFFDIINHTNFLPPNSGLFVPCLTAPTAPACIADFAGSPAGSGGFEANPTFGQIASTTGNAATGGSQRVIQFALKLIF